MFNHESPRRGETFVTRKITRFLTRKKLGSKDILYLGNLNAMRDWGHAKDYVDAMWLILQQDHPEDFVVATGIQYSVREFIEAAAKVIDINIKWKGKGSDEKGFDEQGRCIVAIDERYFRPTEVDNLLGDAAKAKEKLGGTPKITFKELVSEMMSEDLTSAERDELAKKHGYDTYKRR